MIEFCPNVFEYNRPVAACLLPCWLVILAFGGKTIGAPPPWRLQLP